MTTTKCPLCSGQLDYAGTQLACSSCKTAFSGDAFSTQRIPADTMPIPYTTVAADLGAFARKHGTLDDAGRVALSPRVGTEPSVDAVDGKAVTQRLRRFRVDR